MPTPCIAEVRSWPIVNTTGKITNPAAAETTSSSRARAVDGGRRSVVTTSGAATTPASTVRSTATQRGSRSSVAMRVRTGVAPQNTITASAIPTGAAATRVPSFSPTPPHTRA